MAYFVGIAQIHGSPGKPGKVNTQWVTAETKAIATQIIEDEISAAYPQECDEGRVFVNVMELPEGVVKTIQSDDGLPLNIVVDQDYDVLEDDVLIFEVAE